MTRWDGAPWRKSMTSDSGGCVEVARVGGIVGVRDSKGQGRGPILEFNAVEWRAFLVGVVGGEFDYGVLDR